MSASPRSAPSPAMSSPPVRMHDVPAHRERDPPQMRSLVLKCRCSRAAAALPQLPRRRRRNGAVVDRIEIPPVGSIKPPASARPLGRSAARTYRRARRTVPPSRLVLTRCSRGPHHRFLVHHRCGCRPGSRRLALNQLTASASRLLGPDRRVFALLAAAPTCGPCHGVPESAVSGSILSFRSSASARISDAWAGAVATRHPRQRHQQVTFLPPRRRLPEHMQPVADLRLP